MTCGQAFNIFQEHVLVVNDVSWGPFDMKLVGNIVLDKCLDNFDVVERRHCEDTEKQRVTSTSFEHL